MLRFSSAFPRASTSSARRIDRRTILKGLAAGAGALAIGDLAVPFFAAPTVSQAAPIPREQLRIGATFSPLEARYMETDEREMLEGILSLNLDFIRLGAYWNELEQRDGVYEFERLDWMLELCEQRNIPVILTIGVKAPVWPEFHIPWWVWETTWLPPTGLLTRSERLVELGHRFTRTVAERYAATPIVTVLQVENEPYEPVLTERIWSLDEPFVRRQVAIVREADRLNRPILLTAYVASYRILAGLQGMLARPTGAALFDLVLGQRPLSGFIEMAD
ncbi:MAG: beta-galactosidase, partial [Dehalococcoidia bacterium]|nr:beta-galactosidase [Dehalococcoidia bacterium]